MRSDVLVYISGPMTAKDGRTMERYAKFRGLPVFFSADELAEALPARLTDSETGTALGSANECLSSSTEIFSPRSDETRR